MEDVVRELTDAFPSRKSQINLLTRLLGQIDDEFSLPYNILLHGPPATGKTTLLKKFLELTKKDYIFVDCHECYTERLIFNIIIHKLCKGNISDDESSKSGTFEEFFHLLKQSSQDFRSTRFIVLKNSENLSPSLVRSFLCLPRILCRDNWNFCFIFIDLVTTLYDSHIGDHIVRIFFPRHNREQLTNVLRATRKPDYPEQIFNNFLQIFVPQVYQIYRDVNELKRMIDILFPLYKKPIDNSKISSDQLYGLHKVIENRLKTDLNSSIHPFLYKIFSYSESASKSSDSVGPLEDSDWESASNDSDSESGSKFIRPKKRPKNTVSESASKEYEFLSQPITLDLPDSTKYLLVAAYVASYSPSKFDKKLFCKMSTKEKRRNVSADTLWKKRVDLYSAPKIFNLNRLLAIYFVISNDTNVTSSLLSQVTSLVELKLITFVGADDGNLNCRNYKCTASFDYVDDISKSVNIDLKMYLIE